MKYSDRLINPVLNFIYRSDNYRYQERGITSRHAGFTGHYLGHFTATELRLAAGHVAIIELH